MRLPGNSIFQRAWRSKASTDEPIHICKSLHNQKEIQFLAMIGYHLEKAMLLLRRSTNRFIIRLLHKSGNADEPGRVASIETNDSIRI